MTSNGAQAYEPTMVTAEEDGARIVRNHVLASTGVGLIPLPAVDLVGLTGVQLNMLRRLTKAYSIPFSKDKGKNVIASLIGGVASIPIAGSIASLVKTIPLIGQTVGILTMPATAGCSDLCDRKGLYPALFIRRNLPDL